MARVRYSLGWIAVAVLLATGGFSRAAEPAASMTVEIKIGSELNGHDLVGESDSFAAAAEKLIGWTWIKGAPEPTDIIHEWLFKGTVVSTVKLPVRSSSFRTFSRKSVTGKIGDWELVVKDSTGQVLGRRSFQVTENATLAPK
jgi:hypothetical protein